MKSKKIIITIFLFFMFFIGGAIIFANAVLDKMKYTNWSDTELISEENIINETEDLTNLKEVNDIVFDETEILGKIPNVSNILLIGEENVYGDKRGRTDSMMILTINKEKKSLKLTSLMRDSYVRIEGYKDNRLNVAYSIGGVPLLKETIENNFGITLDNTVLVNFDAFEKIIDILGGIDIEITEDECEYLNTTNYISNEKYHTLKPGLNHFNGNQALGYARIRYVSSSNGETSDFGRTNRHRVLLNALYEKYKSTDIKTLIELMNEILPYITTDISKSEILNYLIAIVTMSPDTIETLRLPIDGGYEPVSIRKMSVLQLDMDKNREALKQFIYE